MSWDNFLESIRKTLVKVILPIRSKREKFLSNFRLSIILQISMGYRKLLLTYGVLLAAGLFLIFMYTEKENYRQMSNDIVASIQEEIGRASCRERV